MRQRFLGFFLTVLVALASPAVYGQGGNTSAPLTGTAVDASVSCHDAVARDGLVFHAEVTAAVGHELVELFERSGIEEQIDALARGELSCLVLTLEAILAAAELSQSLQFSEPLGGRQTFASLAS